MMAKGQWIMDLLDAGWMLDAKNDLLW